MFAYIKQQYDHADSLATLLATDIRFTIGSIFAIIATVYVYYYYFKFQHWSRIGLKTPFPLPIIGTLYQIFTLNRIDLELKNVEKYGKLHGSYTGTRPRLHVADPDVLRQMCVKDFHLFTNHHLTSIANEYQSKFIFFMKDAQWKKVRSIITPTFTSGKIKRMTKIMSCCIDDLALIFENSALKKQPINCKDAFGLYTMDVIASCLYAIKLQRSTYDSAIVKVSSNSNDKSSRESFVQDSVDFANPKLSRILMVELLPDFFLNAFGISSPARSVFERLAGKSKALISTRRRSGKKVDDFLQLLIDARLNDKMELTDMDEMENHHVGLTKKIMQADHDAMSKEVEEELTKSGNQSGIINNKNIALTETEIVANAMFLLAVGYDTTASLLSHCVYSLAFHKDIQSKLYEELASIVNKEDKSFEYDKITSASYLDSVICETLRSMSPVILLDREAKEDYHIEKYNVTIPKGTVATMNFFAIHNNPEYWPNPRKFDPSRFFPENRDKIHPGSYTPFGHGPRHCIGARFSLTEAKLALARLLIDYEFSPKPGTSYPPQISFTVFLLRYKNLEVMVNKR